MRDKPKNRAAADRLRARLAAEKQSLGGIDFEWCPHDTPSNVDHLSKLFASHEQAWPIWDARTASFRFTPSPK